MGYPSQAFVRGGDFSAQNREEMWSFGLSVEASVRVLPLEITRSPFFGWSVFRNDQKNDHCPESSAYGVFFFLQNYLLPQLCCSKVTGRPMLENL